MEDMDFFSHPRLGNCELSRRMKCLSLSGIWHSRRVGVISYTIAEVIFTDYTPEELEIAFWGGYFHDIGKCTLNPDYLLHPEIMTESQRNVYLHHPQFGVDILNRFCNEVPSIAEGIEVVNMMVENHHCIDKNGLNTFEEHEVKDVPMLGQICSLGNMLDHLIISKSVQNRICKAYIRPSVDEMLKVSKRNCSDDVIYAFAKQRDKICKIYDSSR